MRKTRLKKPLSLLLCIMLLAAMALFTTACTGNNSNEAKNNQQTNDIVTELGEGETSFLFTVTDGDGNLTQYQIHTDKTIVGDALLELELIAGEEGPFGLYVKTVDGITVDYDKDGKYWAFYMDGEYALTGVDTTTITENATYSFKVE